MNKLFGGMKDWAGRRVTDNKKGEEEKQKGRQKEEEEKKGNHAKDDTLKGSEKEKKLEGQSSPQEPTPTTQRREEEKSKGKEIEEAEIPEKKNKGEKTEENKGIKIFPKRFDITWGDDARYWIRPTDETSPAELKQVCWLQVTGSKKVKIGKSYEIKFNITLKADAFGWNGLPLFMMAKIGPKGKSIWKKIKPLEMTTPDNPFDIPNAEEKFIVKIPGDKDDEEQELFFGFYEIWSNKWKGRLYINYATVEEARPEDVA